MRNILVTGSNGQLGRALKDVSFKLENSRFYFTDIEELDITSENKIREFLTSNNINFIINCAAYTAVDKAETDRKNAYLVNVTAVENLAKKASETGATLINISTDYVFDGNSKDPYKEDQPPNPNSYYGETKYLGEQKILEFSKKAIIIRTAWLYSEYGNNFVKTMIRLAGERDQINVVNDQIGSPTYAGDLAEVILILIKDKIDGVEFYHYSNEGSCSWYEFAVDIMKLKKINCNINPITSSEYPTAAARPKYSLLDKTKIKQKLKIEIPQWHDSLKTCLQHI